MMERQTKRKNRDDMIKNILYEQNLKFTFLNKKQFTLFPVLIQRYFYLLFLLLIDIFTLNYQFSIDFTTVILSIKPQ